MKAKKTLMVVALAAAGLMVAIPSVVAFNYFTKQVEMLTLAMEGSANHLLGAVVKTRGQK